MKVFIWSLFEEHSSPDMICRIASFGKTNQSENTNSNEIHMHNNITDTPNLRNNLPHCTL